MMLNEVLRPFYNGEVKFDACDFAPKVQATDGRIHIRSPIKYVEKTSVSLSDVAFSELILNDGSSVPIAMKIFFKYLGRTNDELFFENAGLNYEIAVYRYVTENFLRPSLSPNFIGYIGEGVCNAPSLRNVINIDQLQKICKGFCSNEITISITNAVGPGKDYSLANWTKHKLFSEYQINAIMFQLLYALALMEEKKIQHNDLHSTNVRLQKLTGPVFLCYVINGIQYRFETHFIVYIFDWDYSYCEEIGKNEKIDPRVYEYMIVNQFIPCWDLQRIMMAIIYNERDNAENDSTFLPSFKPFYNLANTNRLKNQVFRLNDEQYKNLASYVLFTNNNEDKIFLSREDAIRVFGYEYVKEYLYDVNALVIQIDTKTRQFKIPTCDGYDNIVYYTERARKPLTVLLEGFREFQTVSEEKSDFCYSADYLFPIAYPADIDVPASEYRTYLKDVLFQIEAVSYVTTPDTHVRDESYTSAVNTLMYIFQHLECTATTRYNTIYIFRTIMNRMDVKPDEMTLMGICSFIMFQLISYKPIDYGTVTYYTGQQYTRNKLKDTVDRLFLSFPDFKRIPTSYQYIQLDHNLDHKSYYQCCYYAELTLLYYAFGQYFPSEIANVAISIVTQSNLNELTEREQRCRTALVEIANDSRYKQTNDRVYSKYRRFFT